jgi:hypothetical protein
MDPRWDRNGTGESMFDCEIRIKKEVTRLVLEYGDPPVDLEYSGGKG